MKILVIKNRLAYDLPIGKLQSWIETRTPLRPVIDVVETDIPLPTFKIFVNNTYGLDGIKELLRASGKVPDGQYHAIAFCYEYAVGAPRVAAWTYPNELNGAPFAEIPCRKEWAQQDSGVLRMMTHELIHCMHRLCWRAGIPTVDTMDSGPDRTANTADDYDQEFDIWSATGNRARNLQQFATHWFVLDGPTTAEQLTAIRRALSLIADSIRELIMGKKSRLKDWASAIEKMEKMPPEFNNPGALRYSPFEAGRKQGASGTYFSYFQHYTDGWEALIHQLRIVANGTSPAYTAAAKKLGLTTCADLTLFQFYEIYAPAADNNVPRQYALFVANQLKVDPNVQVKTLL